MFRKILIVLLIGFANVCFAQGQMEASQVRLGEGGMSQWLEETMKLQDSELKTISELEAIEDQGGSKLKEISYKRMLESRPLDGANHTFLEQKGTKWYVEHSVLEQSILEAEFADLLMKIQSRVNKASADFKILSIENISYVNKMKPYDTQRDVYQKVANNYGGEDFRLNGEYGKFLLSVGNEKNQYYIEISLRTLAQMTESNSYGFSYHDGVVEQFRIFPKMLNARVFKTMQRDVLNYNQKLTDTVSKFLSSSNSFNENFSFFRDYEVSNYSEHREVVKRLRHEKFLDGLEKEAFNGAELAKELRFMSMKTHSAVALGLLGVGGVAYLDLPGLLLSDLSILQQVLGSVATMSTMFGLKLLLKVKGKKSNFYKKFHDILGRSVYYTALLVAANQWGLSGLMAGIVFGAEYYLSVFDQVYLNYKKVKQKNSIRSRDEKLFLKLSEFLNSFETLSNQRDKNSIDREFLKTMKSELAGNSCRKSAG